MLLYFFKHFEFTSLLSIILVMQFFKKDWNNAIIQTSMSNSQKIRQINKLAKKSFISRKNLLIYYLVNLIGMLVWIILRLLAHIKAQKSIDISEINDDIINGNRHLAGSSNSLDWCFVATSLLQNLLRKMKTLNRCKTALWKEKCLEITWITSS